MYPIQIKKHKNGPKKGTCPFADWLSWQRRTEHHEFSKFHASEMTPNGHIGKFKLVHSSLSDSASLLADSARNLSASL